MMPRESLHRYIYLIALCFMAISLPVSVFGMSLSQFIIAGNWLLEGKLREKFRRLRERKSILVFMSLFLVHLLWMIPSLDLAYGFHDIKIKLPVLLLPFLIGTSAPLTKKELYWILNFFVATVVVATLISTAVYFGFTGKKVTDYREMSIYISHIRFSLLIVIALFILLYRFIYKFKELILAEKVFYPFLLLWLMIFLVLLHALTGLVVFGVIGYGYLLVLAFRRKVVWMRIALVIFWLSVPITGLWYVKKVVSDYYNVQTVDFFSADTLTSSGGRYKFDPESALAENGNLVWTFYCEEELRECWNTKSEISFDSTDLRGNKLSFTLVRYMASLGLRKDSASFAQLTKDDILAVESGIPNYIYKKELSLYSIVYQMVWTIDMYIQGFNPSGHSVTQRIEYLKAATRIIRDNFWFGVGTGDVRKSFDEEYVKMNSQLEPKWRLRAHNQFVTFLLTFGIFGFIWVLAAIFLPVYLERKSVGFLFVIVLLAGLLSFINEDTMESQAGVTFFVFFYVLFLFGSSKEAIQEKNDHSSRPA